LVEKGGGNGDKKGKNAKGRRATSSQHGFRGHTGKGGPAGKGIPIPDHPRERKKWGKKRKKA